MVGKIILVMEMVNFVGELLKNTYTTVTITHKSNNVWTSSISGKIIVIILILRIMDLTFP